LVGKEGVFAEIAAQGFRDSGRRRKQAGSLFYPFQVLIRFLSHPLRHESENRCKKSASVKFLGESKMLIGFSRAALFIALNNA